MKALLVLGANVNLLNATGDSPFHMAVKMKDKDRHPMVRSMFKTERPILFWLLITKLLRKRSMKNGSSLPKAFKMAKL